ncbi:putative carbonic anhydrase 5 isoform X2 [Drosophila novamexicana]|uniref:putative carbonic anhydrase 5 isoform X2 n=1 Tax=Drosophila novamexicana TaxID=47314 RepID=UPI0011E5AF6D|nr:putative carbonic anhydrase 5 isoform X2 [Drosophila novamexicana]
MSKNDSSLPNADWNFVENGADWEGTCATGLRQAPIKLSVDSSLIAPLPRILFENYDKRLNSPLTLVNKGYTVEMAIPATSNGRKPFITGGLLKGKYVANGVHFHWGSPESRGAEHLIERTRHDVEMHIVHRNVRYKDIAEAANHPDGIAVLGIMFKIVKSPHRVYPGLRKIFTALPNIVEYHSKTELHEPLTLGQLLGDLNTRHFYTYKGSLTTPDCNEAVIWTVFARPLPLPLSDIQQLWQLQDSNGNPIRNNYRKLQPRNNRHVFYRANKDVSDFYLG